MSGFQFAWRRSGLPVPSVGEVLVGKSTTIRAGDVLIETNNSTYTGTTTGQILVVRPLLSGDTITTSAGIKGVALFDIKTDSSAILTAMTSPVSVDTRGKVDTSMIYTFDLPTDPDSGYIRIPIALFDTENVFAALTNANEIADFYALERAVGITASSSAVATAGTHTIDVDAAAANCPLKVVGVDSEHPQFNSANGGGRLFVMGQPTFYTGPGGTGAYFTT